jgi:hypothetical protein
LYLGASASLGLLSLYQRGLVKRLPEPKLPKFNTDAINSSAEAYSIVSTPDGARNNYYFTFSHANTPRKLDSKEMQLMRRMERASASNYYLGCSEWERGEYAVPKPPITASGTIRPTWGGSTAPGGDLDVASTQPGWRFC